MVHIEELRVSLKTVRMSIAWIPVKPISDMHNGINGYVVRE
jgi:hypothetical protein